MCDIQAMYLWGKYPGRGKTENRYELQLDFKQPAFTVKKTPRILFYIFMQQGNLPHFLDMLRNLCFTFHRVPFVS
jgi:hypothetical protein